MMHLRHIPLMLFGMLALPVMAEQTCDTPAQCNKEGTAAYQAGRFEAAIESFERQLRRVENEDEAGLELAVNNLMLANLRADDAGMARAWLQLALDTNLYGSATRHNLIKVSQALDYPALSASPVGRYLRYSGQAVWSELQISEIPSRSRLTAQPAFSAASFRRICTASPTSLPSSSPTAASAKPPPA